MKSAQKHRSHVRRVSPETIEHYIKILPNFDFLREAHQLGQRPTPHRKEK